MAGTHAFSLGRLNWPVMYSFLTKDASFLERTVEVIFAFCWVRADFPSRSPPQCIMGNWNLKFSHNKEFCRVIALGCLLLCLRLEAAAGRAVAVGHHWGILVGGRQVPQQLSSIFVGIGSLHLHDNKRKSGKECDCQLPAAQPSRSCFTKAKIKTGLKET